ncbi:hypothetical protein RLIN73S_02213 [Rhodanobacter lindaniclasticus]
MLAIRPPTFICAVAPKMMPWVLIRNTWPFELILPKIWLGFWSRMRLSATAERPGWLNSTDSLALRLNVSQFSASFCEIWLITVSLPAWVMLPLPPTTVPPVGPPARASALTAIEPMASPMHRLIGQVLRNGRLPEGKRAVRARETPLRDSRRVLMCLLMSSSLRT